MGLNPHRFHYKDSDDVIWEMNYVVTQSEDEGPEYVEIRKVGELLPTGVIEFDDPIGNYERISEADFDALPRRIRRQFNEHFHGPLIHHEEYIMRLVPDPSPHEPVNVGPSQTVSFQMEGERLFTARMVELKEDDEIWLIITTWPLSGEAGTVLHLKYTDLLVD